MLLTVLQLIFGNNNKSNNFLEGCFQGDHHAKLGIPTHDPQYKKKIAAKHPNLYNICAM